MSNISPLNNGLSKFAYKLKCNMLKLPANIFHRYGMAEKDTYWNRKTNTLFPTWFCEDNNCSDRYYVCDIFHITGFCKNTELTEIRNTLLLDIKKCIAKFSNYPLEKINYIPHWDISPSDSVPITSYSINSCICSTLPENIEAIECPNCGESYHKICVNYAPETLWLCPLCNPKKSTKKVLIQSKLKKTDLGLTFSKNIKPRINSIEDLLILENKTSFETLTLSNLSKA